MRNELHEPKAGIDITKRALIKARPKQARVTRSRLHQRVSQQLGSRRSRVLGQGMEYAESRSYQQGDDVRNIDWGLTARTGKAHTKLFQEERECPCLVAVDLRSMMKFGSRVRFKSHLAADIAAQLAWAGLDKGDRVAGVVLTDTGVKRFKAARHQNGLMPFFEGMVKESDINTSVDAASINPSTKASIKPSINEMLQTLARLSRSGTHVYIISDFYDIDEETEKTVKRLAARAAQSHRVTLIKVTDPLDIRLPRSAGRISNGTAVKSLRRINKKALQRYATDYVERHEQLMQLCLRNGIECVEVSTDSDPKHIARSLRRIHSGGQR